MDDEKHIEDFFRHLADLKVWNSLFTGIRELRQHDEQAWFQEDSFENASYYDRIEFDLFRTFYLSSGEQLICACLLDGFPFPPITKGELHELARQHLAGANSPDEIASAKARFLAHASIIANYSSEDTGISNDISVGGFMSPDTKNEFKTAWVSQYGFKLLYSPSESRFSGTKVHLSGKYSEGAMEGLYQIMRRAAPSASITLQLLESDVNEPVPDDFIPYDFRATPFHAGDERLVKSFDSTPNVFEGFLNAYFSLPTKKSATFEQRLRNAAHLLVEADTQPNHAIGLSLSFSAVEALVCEKTDGIVDELSRHVATLLEPCARERPDSMTAIKKYYTLRSKTLHGDRILGDADARWRVRALAAAVFKACLDWKRHIAMLGVDVVRPDFLKELRDCSSTGQEIVGVCPTLSRFIPTDRNCQSDQ